MIADEIENYEFNMRLNPNPDVIRHHDLEVRRLTPAIELLKEEK